jgi:hypothetical protein
MTSSNTEVTSSVMRIVAGHEQAGDALEDRVVAVGRGCFKRDLERVNNLQRLRHFSSHTDRNSSGPLARAID